MNNSIEFPDVEIPSAFVPYAAYDPHTDCIRVKIRPSSDREMKIDEDITVYRENFPTGFGESYTGFAIKGINHLFYELGLPADTVLTLSEFLDHLVQKRPTTAMTVILDLMRKNLGELEKCEISLAAVA